jgi:hypothetical protein
MQRKRPELFWESPLSNEAPSQLGVRRLLEWLRACESFGWPKSAIPELTDLFWKYKDRNGNLKGEGPTVETTAERHYQPCEVCGVGHDESTPHKSYLRCALCNSPMPNPVPEVRSCCEAGAEFDRNGFAVNRREAL